MTIDIQEASRIYQAGIDVGRAMAKRETEEFAKLVAAQKPPSTTITVAVPRPIVPTGRGVTGKGLPSGTKIAPKATRTRGVKDAIVKLISETPGGITTGDIIAKTGYLKTSVRATLMSMKKAGLASQDGSNWFCQPSIGHGNSEAGLGSEY